LKLNNFFSEGSNLGGQGFAPNPSRSATTTSVKK